MKDSSDKIEIKLEQLAGNNKIVVGASQAQQLLMKKKNEGNTTIKPAPQPLVKVGTALVKRPASSQQGNDKGSKVVLVTTTGSQQKVVAKGGNRREETKVVKPDEIMEENVEESNENSRVKVNQEAPKQQ